MKYKFKINDRTVDREEFYADFEVWNRYVYDHDDEIAASYAELLETGSVEFEKENQIYSFSIEVAS